MSSALILFMTLTGFIFWINLIAGAITDLAIHLIRRHQIKQMNAYNDSLKSQTANIIARSEEVQRRIMSM